MATYFKDLEIPEFFNFQQFLSAQVTTNAVAWNIPPAKATELSNNSTQYGIKYNAITNPQTRTTSQVEAHKNARKDFEQFIAEFANEYIVYNSAISDEKVGELGFNRSDNQPGERSVIDQTVYGEIKPIGGSKVLFTCRLSSDSSRASMHPDADVVLVKYAIGEAPTGPNSCPHKEISTKAKFTIQLTDADVGKKIHAYLQWRNNVNPEKSGPFSSKIETTIV